jgi:hypothetical protein
MRYAGNEGSNFGSSGEHEILPGESAFTRGHAPVRSSSPISGQCPGGAKHYVFGKSGGFRLIPNSNEDGFEIETRTNAEDQVLVNQPNVSS